MKVLLSLKHICGGHFSELCTCTKFQQIRKTKLTVATHNKMPHEH